MIWRIRARRVFTDLRRHGVRSGRGPVAMIHLPAGMDAGTIALTDPPQVGYVIGSRVGNAVVRNRIRRRLRSIMEQLSTDSAESVHRLRAGAYLVRVEPAARDLAHAELAAQVRAAITSVHARTDERSERSPNRQVGVKGRSRSTRQDIEGRVATSAPRTAGAPS